MDAILQIQPHSVTFLHASSPLAHRIPNLTAPFASPLPCLVLPLWETPRKENLVVLKLPSLE